MIRFHDPPAAARSAPHPHRLTPILRTRPNRTQTKATERNVNPAAFVGASQPASDSRHEATTGTQSKPMSSNLLYRSLLHIFSIFLMLGPEVLISSLDSYAPHAGPIDFSSEHDLRHLVFHGQSLCKIMQISRDQRQRICVFRKPCRHFAILVAAGGAYHTVRLIDKKVGKGKARGLGLSWGLAKLGSWFES